MGRKIVITSGKGGVGKTTVTANLGYFLSLLGFKVVLIDGDFGLNNLDITLGIENKVVYDIVDVLEGRSSVRQALICCDEKENLFVLPSNHSYDKSKMDAQNVKIIVNRLEETFDYVLIDCPAGIELGFHRAVGAVNQSIIVTTPSISSIKDASKVVSMLKSYQNDILGVVVNMARGDLMVTGDMIGIEEISSLLQQQTIGVIPDDDLVGLHTSLGVALTPNTSAYDAFSILAKNIMLGESHIFDVEKKFKGVFGKIKRDLKRRV